MEQVVFISITVAELEFLIRKCIREECRCIEKPNEDESLLTEKQVRELLGVSRITLKQWRDKGIIPYHRFGSRIRYKKSEILDRRKHIR